MKVVYSFIPDDGESDRMGGGRISYGVGWRRGSEDAGRVRKGSSRGGGRTRAG